MNLRTKTIAGGLSVALLSLGLASACSGDDDGSGGGTGSSGSGDGDFNLGGQFTGNGGGSGAGANADCGQKVEAAPLKANVLFVIDTSESMTKGTPDGFTKNKWDTLKDALKAALPEVQDLLSMGAKFYPSSSSGECGVSGTIDVPVKSGADGADGILDALTLTPAGGTPTAAALNVALEYYTSGAGKDLEGDKYVLLATDGGPNCSETPKTTCACMDAPCNNGKADLCTTNIDGTTCGAGNTCCVNEETSCLDDENTLAAVEDLAAAGVKTIVLGMPGTEAYASVLNALATKGGLAQSGTDKYIKVQNAAELEEALRAVTRNLIRSCDIQLDAPPMIPLQVNVYLDDVVIPKDDSDGWTYGMDGDALDTTLIKLVGPTCTQVEKEGVENIRVQSGCDTIVR